MPAGIKYDLATGKVIEELCRFDTVYRLSGGVNLADSTLQEGSFVPVLCPLAVDMKTRKAIVVKNVKVMEDAAAAATDIKIGKGSFATIGMILGTGAKGAAIQSIDKTNSDFDTITLAASFGAAVKKGDVLFEAATAAGTTPKDTANFLNYARTKVESGATLTLVGRAYEVKESELFVPISAKDKEGLTSRFMFV